MTHDPDPVYSYKNLDFSSLLQNTGENHPTSNILKNNTAKKKFMNSNNNKIGCKIKIRKKYYIPVRYFPIIKCTYIITLE
jgi:hypothetical protein